MNRIVGISLTLILIGACGPGVRLGEPPADSGPPRDMTVQADMGNPPVDMGNPPADMSQPTDGGTDGSVAADGGTGAPSCEERAQFECARLLNCDRGVFERRWEDMATCVARSTEVCTAQRRVPDTNGYDYAACDAAYGTPLSCDALLDGEHVPLACLPRSGEIATDTVNCVSDDQCGRAPRDGDLVQLFCTGRPGCPDRICNYTSRTGSATSCMTNPRQCDARAGAKCVRRDLTMGASFGCFVVMYRGSGTDCGPGTAMQCAGGFYCNASSGTGTCMAVLARGARCSADLECDSRHLDTCQPDPMNPTQNICTAPVTALIGGLCGAGTAGNVVCSDQAYCDSTNHCQPRIAQGMTCLMSEQCRQGLVCTGSVCTPPAPTCS